MVDALHSMIEFVFMAFLGGLTRAVILAKSARELMKWNAIKALVLAPIAGILYFYMYSEWNAPNHVITFFFAYSFIDIVDRLAKIIISLGKKGS